MPVVGEATGSWADDVEENETLEVPPPPAVLPPPDVLPPPEVVIEGEYKIVTEYKFNEFGRKVKVVRTIKIEKRKVSKCVAMRNTWAKFGPSKDDKPGPDPATTLIAEDVFMQFLTNKEEENKPDERGLEKLKGMGEKGVVKCRKCSGDHWTSKCPYKDAVLPAAKKPEEKKLNGEGAVGGAEEKPKTMNKYIPPNMREGNNKKGEVTTNFINAIHVSNLSQNTTEKDLEELVKPFGPIEKRFLAKDRTGRCKGFAYVHFKTRSDAAKAIATLNGHGYDHLILSVDWSKLSLRNN